MFRSLKPHQLVIDVSIAVVCALFELLVNGLTISLVALAGMATALALRRLSPTLALGIAWVTALIQVLFAIGPDPSNLAILPVLYATASYGTPVVKWAGLVSSGVGALVIALYLSVQSLPLYWHVLYEGGSTAAEIVPQAASQFVIWFFLALAMFLLSWTFGLLAKTWRTARESGQARIVAERQRIDAQQNVVIEQERGRIARDMHDVVAHSLAVVIAQADGARYAMESDPPAAAAALETISTTAREALGDVRILLGQLRHSQSDFPQPVLTDLDRLIDQVRASGLPVRFEQEGEPIPLGTGKQLAVYRIVQEALTNALRYGDTGRGTLVTLIWGQKDLAITVSSALRPSGSEPERAPDSELGHGLAGMKERAILAGGSFTAEPRADRFVVTASLPLETVGAGA